MVGAPPNIRQFEALSLVSVFIGFIGDLATGSLIGSIVQAESSNLVGAAKGRAVGAALGAATGEVVGVAIFIALTLLVSRRRKNWARWSLLVFQASGLAFVAWQGRAQAIFSVDQALATGLVWLMQAVALVLAFTPQSTRWLRGESKESRNLFG